MLARGAWASTAWTVASIRNLFAGEGDTPVQPNDIDPYGLWADPEKKKSTVLPYDPAIMQALQDKKNIVR